MRIYVCLLFMFLAALESGSVRAALNSPNVSANTLLLYRNSNFSRDAANTVRNGFDLQEAELAFFADVDPYSRLNMLLSVHPVYTLNTATNKVEESFTVEPEELFAESNHVPSLTLKAGKFKAAFGRHNLLHTHAQPFVDAPVVNAVLLGDEGLNDVGLSVAYLLPTAWFSELTAQYLRGEGENKEFSSATPSDAVGLVHWKNLWDLSDALTFELGGSYAKGANSLQGMTALAGSDISFKWRPESGGKYRSWILAGEFIRRKLEQPAADNEIGGGWNVWGQYQFAERWSALVRYDHLRVKGSDAAANPDNVLPNIVTKKYSAALVFSATEFSSFRAEYNYAHGPVAANGEANERKIYLQANFTIGAHPAHSY